MKKNPTLQLGNKTNVCSSLGLFIPHFFEEKKKDSHSQRSHTVTRVLLNSDWCLNGRICLTVMWSAVVKSGFLPTSHDGLSGRRGWMGGGERRPITGPTKYQCWWTSATEIHVLTAGGGRKRLELRSSHMMPTEAGPKKWKVDTHIHTSQRPGCHPSRRQTVSTLWWRRGEHPLH